MHSVTLSQESAENLHVDVQEPFADFFFFFSLLPWPTHKFQTYYDPQTHFCLLNKIFNFVELHLHPFQPYMYSQVKRQSKTIGHFICFSSHTAPRPCCQLYSVKMTVLIFCLVLLLSSVQFSSVQSLSCVRLFATPWTAACQASLSITNSRSLLKLMSIELVMPSISFMVICCQKANLILFTLLWPSSFL